VVARRTFNEMVEEGSMELPGGRPFARFPLLTKLTHGLQGIFVIGGAPGVGKSTLAAHLAADVACEDFPGVYFETENRLVVDGKVRSLAVDRAARAYGKNHEGLRHLWYVPDYDEALATLRSWPRGFLVVDTLQGSLGYADYDASKDAASHNALNARVLDLLSLVEAGYAVLAVSHVGRQYYRGCPPLSSFRLSGAIEQGTWVAVGYWAPPRRTSERSLRVLKARVPVEPAYRDAVLRIAADAQERLTEAGLVAGRALTDTATPAPSCPVLRVLQQSDTAMSTGDICAALRRRMSRRSVERRLSEHLQAGHIERVGRGGYRQTSAKSSANVAERNGGMAEAVNPASELTKQALMAG
jgi:hypothetical protein